MRVDVGVQMCARKRVDVLVLVLVLMCVRPWVHAGVCVRMRGRARMDVASKCRLPPHFQAPPHFRLYARSSRAPRLFPVVDESNFGRIRPGESGSDEKFADPFPAVPVNSPYILLWGGIRPGEFLGQALSGAPLVPKPFW